MIGSGWSSSISIPRRTVADGEGGETGDLIGILSRWAVEVVHSFGYPGVAVLIALANMSLPVPSEAVLPLAGFLVSEGRFSFPLALLSATVGAVAGALVLYALGHWLGEECLRRLIGRFGRFVLVSGSDLDKANGWFERHGRAAIVICHLLPGVGAYISIPAGLTRMPVLKRFVVYTGLGTGLWNGAFIVLGWVLGAQWRLARHYLHVLEYGVLAAVAGIVLWHVWRRWKTRG